MLFEQQLSKFKLSCLFLATIQLSGCGGGGSESGESTPLPQPLPTYNIYGGAVKGPLSNTPVRLYKFDASKTDGLGALMASVESEENTTVQDLIIQDHISGYYIVEFTADDNSIDITTNKVPAFQILRNIIHVDQIKSAKPVYATPLSTLTVKLAIKKNANFKLF